MHFLSEASRNLGTVVASGSFNAAYTPPCKKVGARLADIVHVRKFDSSTGRKKIEI